MQEEPTMWQEKFDPTFDEATFPACCALSTDERAGQALSRTDQELHAERGGGPAMGQLIAVADRSRTGGGDFEV